MEQEIKISSPFLNAHQGAEYLNLSYTYFCQLLREKRIKHYRAGGKILIKIDDIEEYLESVAVNPEQKIDIKSYYKSKYKTPGKIDVNDYKNMLGIKD